ncbi:MAG: NAD-dependent epimerase/dehydratase family protein [Pseudomonadota bacterium]
MALSALDFILEDYRKVIGVKQESLAALKNDAVVITGGTGFIGTWLTGLITYLNDYHSFNTQVVLIAKNINHFKVTRPHLANRKDVKLIAADVRYLMELPADTNWLIHAAGTPDNRFHATYPLETMSTIANGTYSVLRAVERCSNFKMLLNLSSGLIYGQQPFQQELMDENFAGAPKCGTASSAYAEAKRYAETLCHASRSQARIPVVTARPFAFMGPYQSLEAPWALNNFIKDALSGHEIRVLGDGETVRSYMYASDLAFWLLSILSRSQSGEVYNVGSAESVTLAELASRVANQFDFKVEIKLRTSAATALQNSRFVPDVTSAQIKLQLGLTVDLTAAIERTIAWNQLIHAEKNPLRDLVW